MQQVPRRSLIDDRHRMVTANLGFAVKLGLNVARGRLEYDDVVGAASLAMVEAGGFCNDVAVDQFKAGRSALFLTYAAFYIKNRVRKSIQDGKLIRIPISYHWTRSSRSADEVAARRANAARLANPVSLSDGVDPVTGESVRFEAVQPESEGEDERIRLLPIHLFMLSDREREVLAARFGLGGVELQSHKKIGTRLGVSHTTVRTIERRALARLRQSFGADGWRATG